MFFMMTKELKAYDADRGASADGSVDFSVSEKHFIFCDKD